MVIPPSGRGRGACDRVRIVDTVYNLRAATGVQPFDDPRELADAMGIDPCPDPLIVDVRIDGAALRYGIDLPMCERGSLIYGVLASVIAVERSLRGAESELRDELIWPRSAAMGLPVAINAQRHATRRDLERIFLARLGSGTFSLQDVAPSSQR